MSLDKFLLEILDNKKSLKHTSLTQLSGLTPVELEQVKGIWLKIEPQRRRTILSRLVDMAEDNIDLDFTDVFKFGLQDQDENVKETAISGLWECEDRTLISTFIALLKTDSSEKVKAAAAIALGKFVSLAEEGKLLSKDCLKIKEALLAIIQATDKPLEVRRRAIESVAYLDDPVVKKLILDTYKSPEPKMRQSAVFAMGKNCDLQWLPIILQELESDDQAMKYEATCACRELGDEAAVPHLIPLLKDEDSQIQLSAIQALGAIGGAVAKRALLVCAKSSDENISEAARETLKEVEFDADPLNFRYNI